MSDIATRVKKIIIDKLGVDESEVTNEATFTNDLGADSLDTQTRNDKRRGAGAGINWSHAVVL